LMEIIILSSIVVASKINKAKETHYFIKKAETLESFGSFYI